MDIDYQPKNFKKKKQNTNRIVALNVLISSCGLLVKKLCQHFKVQSLIQH